jgi:hypothetical protein
MNLRTDANRWKVNRRESLSNIRCFNRRIEPMLNKKAANAQVGGSGTAAV